MPSKLLFTAIIFGGMAYGQSATILPNTTLAVETGNNTSGSSSFLTQSNGNIAPGNISKVPLRSALYADANSKIYAHFMPWFGGANHMNVGYRSDDTTQVAKQVRDMIERGIDGAIIDWYGPNYSRENNTTLYFMRAAEANPGFQFAVMSDAGALKSCANTAGCDITQRQIDHLNYANNTYYNSPAYMRVDGRPVVFFFGQELYAIDWNRVRANVLGNPIFIQRNSGAFTKTQMNGGYAWLAANMVTASDPSALLYLNDFYSQAARYQSMPEFGSAYPGFDDSLASWTGNKLITRQCGQTWLKTLAHAGNYYSSGNQLPAIQLVTWNDYEEGSALETGVENCVSVSAAVAGNTATWAITGDQNTLDHFKVFISTDGQNLMWLRDVAASEGALELGSYGFAPGTYLVHVKAIGKPMMTNKMSAAAAYLITNQPPTVQTVLSSTTAQAPVTITASTVAADADGSIASGTINFGDGTLVNAMTASHVYSAAGTFTVTSTVTDNLGATASSNATVTVTNIPSKVEIASPANAASVSSPMRIVATGSSGAAVTSMQVYIDNVLSHQSSGANLDTSLSVMAGARYIVVKGWDASGKSFMTAINVTVMPNQSPVASMAVTQSGAYAPATVTASLAGSSDPDGSITGQSIDFGDGTIVNGASASHVYAMPGTYTVRGTVTDNAGASTSMTRTVTVATPPSYVNIVSPKANSQQQNKVRVVADSFSFAGVTAMQIYADDKLLFEVKNTSRIDTVITLKNGNRRLVVKAWDAKGASVAASVEFKVASTGTQTVLVN